MAYYARLNQNNRVEQVLAIPNDQEPTEADGIAYCRSLWGHGVYKKTSYNRTIRKNYAGIGYSYDPIRDAFIPPRPFPSWTLDETACTWQPPEAYPQDGHVYRWDEYTQTWSQVT